MSDESLTRWRQEVRRVIPDADDELVEEVAQHAADRWTALRVAGHSIAECDRRATTELLGWRGAAVPGRRRRWRASRPWTGSTHDIRYALRALRVRPAFTVGGALLAGVAIAANLTAFAVVYGVLWRPLPYPDADRLVVLWQVRKGEQGQVSYPDYADVAGTPVFDTAAAISGGRGSLRVGDRIERVNIIDMAPAGYTMLGARPAHGRLLDDSDGGKPHAMISHRLWRGPFNSDPAIVGRSVWISGHDYVVVGVLQPNFDFELPIAPMLKLGNQDVWTAFDHTSPFVARRDVTTYEALLRLAPGVSLEQARAAVDATAKRLSTTYPATNADRLLRLESLKTDVVRSMQRPLLLVAGAALLALMIALANLGMLALMRSSDRGREIAIRQALGASAFRLRRQILTEGLLVSAAGGIIGVLAAGPLIHAVIGADAMALPRRDAIRLDGSTIACGLALTLVMAVVLSLMLLRRTSLSSELRGDGRVIGHHARLPRNIMIAAELALALVLCTGGALLGLSLARLFATDPGFNPSAALAMRVSTYEARYPARDDVLRFFASVTARLEAMPDVAKAAAGSSLPLSGQTSGTGVLAEGQSPSADSRLTAGWQFITPGYFDAVGMRLREGRDFIDDDRRHEGHVTIINEDLARRLFPNGSAVGRRIGVGGGEAEGDWHQIIGVVSDVRHTALDAAPSPRVYDLFGEHWGRTLFVVARTRVADPAPLIASVRGAINALDPEVPIFEASTMDSLVRRSAAPRRIAALLAAGLAATALLLALIGVYAVAAASVAERTREIGIRSALGAAPSDLLRLITREGAATSMLGGVVGLMASAAATRALQAQLFGVHGTDILLIVPLSCAFLVAAAVAATLPAARRAASADPLVAMRAE